MELWLSLPPDIRDAGDSFDDLTNLAILAPGLEGDTYSVREVVHRRIYTNKGQAPKDSIQRVVCGLVLAIREATKDGKVLHCQLHKVDISSSLGITISVQDFAEFDVSSATIPVFVEGCDLRVELIDPSILDGLMRVPSYGNHFLQV